MENVEEGHDPFSGFSKGAFVFVQNGGADKAELHGDHVMAKLLKV